MAKPTNDLPVAPDHEHWSRVAHQWIEWAGTPNHDVYWAYRESLAAFIGPGNGRALDAGCGEGRVSRDLKSIGYHVTASDTVAAMVEAAARADSAHEYAVANMASLPFSNEHFDLVVAYNVLMDVDHLAAAVKELKRVLRSTGQLMISIVHPFADRGRFASTAPDAAFVLQGTYFGEQRFEGAEERNGLRMDFAGWSRPLEIYAAALEKAGLAITSIREPVPAESGQWAALKKWTRVPLFLWLKARPLAR